MKSFKVLGSGCAKCSKTAQAISAVAEELNIAATVEKVTDPQVIMAFGVMSTPAVVVDEKLVHSGSIPSRVDIEKWLADL
jgi:small redox-active disulfide protein 2